MQALSGFAAYTALIHPGPAAFVGPRVQIEVKAGDDLTLRQYLEQLYIAVITIKFFYFTHLEPVQPSHHFKQARKHSIDRKVGANVLLRYLIARLAQFFAVIVGVPSFQTLQTIFLSGVCFQFRPLPACLRQRFLRQLIQKAFYAVRAVGHLGCQRQIGVVIESQELRKLVSQLQRLRNQFGIIPLAGIGTLL